MYILDILLTSTGFSTTTAAADDTSSLHMFIISLYSVAGFLMGVGHAPFMCLGLTYIDDNVAEVHDTTKYLGRN